MSGSYEKWLDRAYEKFPKGLSKKSRFELPEIQSIIIGNRTFMKNFKHICETINRDEQHILKYLVKEMATAGNMEGEQVIFQGKFGANLIKHLLEEYVKKFIICPVCRSPDTKLIKEDRFRFLVCEACGAKSSLGTG